MEKPWIQDVLVFWQSPGDNESSGAATSESQQDDSLQVGFCESNITETKSWESIV